MKTIFVEARYKTKVDLPDALINKLPKRVALFTSIQFLDGLNSAKKRIEEKNKQVLLLKTRHTKHAGQLLGCNIQEFKEDFDAFLYVGDGLFHPKALMLKNNKPVFVYNPLSKKHFELKSGGADDLKNKTRAGLMKFMQSKQVGVLVSTKPGQNNLEQAQGLEKKYPDKEFYFLLFDTLDFAQLENFPFIQCFVNTACPRITFDEAGKIRNPVVNIDDLY